MNDNRTFQEKLWCYPALDRAERAELEEIVRNHPEWQGHFQAAVRWAAFLSSSRSLNDPDSDEDTIAYTAVMDRLPDSVLPEDLVSPLARMKRRIEADPVRRNLFVEYQRRFEEFESESDAVSHFEAVTGHSFAHESVTEATTRTTRFRRDRSLVPRAKSAPVLRGIKRGSTLLIGLYLVLLSLGHLGASNTDRLARLQSNDLHWTELGVSTRGDDPAWENQLIARYTAATREAARAKRSVLGLFPSYDYEKVGRARILLEDTIRIQERLEKAPASAYLLLAKLNLLMHDIEAAKSALHSARMQGGDAAARARRLLALSES